LKEEKINQTHLPTIGILLVSVKPAIPALLYLIAIPFSSNRVDFELQLLLIVIE